MDLWLTMGIKPDGRSEAPLRAALRRLDLGTGRVSDVLTWETPAGRVASAGEHQEFTAAWADGDRLWLPTRTEVLCVDPGSGEIVKRLDHPWLYDVHAVAPWRGGLVVAATGADAVLWFDRDGRLGQTWDLAGTLAALPPGADLRTWPFERTKPRRFHPNHLWPDGDRLWVTELETRRCRVIEGQPGEIGFPGPPHDGRVMEGRWWFTTVDGRVLGLNPETWHVEVDLDVPALERGDGLPGWCRAVAVVGSRLFVGMTMLRAGRHREWLRRALRGAAGEKKPTRIVEIDLVRREVTRVYPVGNEAGGTIYSILPG